MYGYEDRENPAEVRKGPRIGKILAIILIVLLCTVLIGGSIFIAIADKSPTGPNGWLFSGLESIFSNNKNAPFAVEIKFRPAESGTNWSDTTIAEVGARVEIQAQYSNRSPDNHEAVAIWANLPTCLAYEEGSTVLYNSSYPDGLTVVQDDIVSRGLYIGSYKGYDEGSETKRGANAFLRFTVEVTESGIEVGDTSVPISISGKVADTTIENHGEITIRK